MSQNFLQFSVATFSFLNATKMQFDLDSNNRDGN